MSDPDKLNIGQESPNIKMTPNLASVQLTYDAPGFLWCKISERIISCNINLKIVNYDEQS